MQKVKILNSFISKGTFQEFIEQIFNLVGAKKSSYVCFANVHMVIEAYRDASFNKVLSQADLVTPDGAPVSKVMSWFYKYTQDRVAGMDLMPLLLVEAEKRNKSVYFYGSTDEVLSGIVERTNRELPNLRVAGVYSPPFRKLSQEEDQEIVNRINSSGADLVFVALGCPKQENWMATHMDRINGCMLGVGQAFLVYAGLEKRLPKWARDYCLEWVYRLYLEPGRLWKRYLYTNSLFLFLVTKLAFTKSGRTITN
ncbi:MAG TPA: WecB/TagA/CpsF family glycosyltransferase [Cytophagales bacterium]|nr:WecB/TagA/CpsF family glycosyltransferase [Cytophagales bacterium]